MKRLIAIAIIPIVVLVCTTVGRCQEDVAMSASSNEKAVPLRALARMPVKEITIFKDGHAFVLHEGEMPTDAQGNVVMDYLPSPVLGTFWPYCADPDAALTAVVAGRRRVIVKRTALTLCELLEANTGVQVRVKENNGSSYAATILGIPTRSSEELQATSLPNSNPLLPLKGNLILLKTEEGTKVVALNSIQDVTFLGSYNTMITSEEFRNVLTLKLDWKGRKPKKKVKAGLLYLQKGVRWIPSYKVNINDNGKAAVKLQATLINELTDLKDLTANLVIGVPTFAFKDTPDPIALQQAAASLSRYFRRGSQSAYALSNAIMTQSANMGNYRGQPAAPRPADLGPEMPAGAKSEDLFVFTVKHISLKKGERMVLPVAEYSLDYKHVYTLNIPFAPPPELRKHFNSSQRAAMAKLYHAPKVMHKIRLFNKSSYPLTTAPALIVRDGRLLAQGMMTYTAIGANSDLDITTAIDIRVKKLDEETGRTPNAATWQGYKYARVDMSGIISLTNYRSQAVNLEIVRHVLGNIGEAGHGGVAKQLNIFEDGECYPQWWGGSYGWYSWWHHFNGVGRIKWNIKLEPGKSIKLQYTYHYYWR